MSLRQARSSVVQAVRLICLRFKNHLEFDARVGCVIGFVTPELFLKGLIVFKRLRVFVSEIGTSGLLKSVFDFAIV